MFQIMCAASTASKIHTPASKSAVFLSMSTDELAAKVASLESAISRLDASFGRIETFLFIATLLVVIGLIVEYWDDAGKLRVLAWQRRTGLHSGSHDETFGHAFRAVLGGILVTIGVAWELIEEVQAYRIETRASDNNKVIVGLLTDEAKVAEGKIAADDKIAQQAAKDAANLKLTLAGLHDFVTTAQTKIHQETIEAATTVTTLSRATTDLEAKRKQAIAAATQAKKSLAEVNKVLSDEQAMRDKIKELTTPYALKDASGLTSKMRAFRGTKFNICLEPEERAMPLAIKMGKALKDAGWDWQPSQSWSMGADRYGVPSDLPTMCIVGSGEGIAIQPPIDGSLNGPATSLRDALAADGIPDVSVTDKDDAARNEKNFGSIPQNAIRIWVGHRPSL